jgi:hypothetical protein
LVGTQRGEILVYDFIDRKQILKLQFFLEHIIQFINSGEDFLILTNKNVYLIGKDHEFEKLDKHEKKEKESSELDDRKEVRYESEIVITDARDSEVVAGGEAEEENPYKSE